MGWLDSLFGGNRKTKVDKLVKKLMNGYSQTHERIRAMEILADAGTDEALSGILQRFTYRTEASIVDEEEKELAYRLLCECGAGAIPPIQRFVRSQDAVYWPLKALREIAGMDMAVDLLLQALDRADQVDTRVNKQKVELVSNLRDFPHPRVQERLLVYAEDADEECRVLAIDGLMVYGEAIALPAAAARLLEPAEVARVKMVILEQLIENEWSLSKWREELTEGEFLPFPYQIGARGMVVRAT